MRLEGSDAEIAPLIAAEPFDSVWLPVMLSLEALCLASARIAINAECCAGSGSR